MILERDRKADVSLQSPELCCQSMTSRPSIGVSLHTAVLVESVFSAAASEIWTRINPGLDPAKTLTFQPH
jgi:hypothetical protein